MIKSLQALERLKREPTEYVGCISDMYTKLAFEFKTIEKDLQDKALQDIILNIIKVKGVEVGFLRQCDNLEAYNCHRDEKWSQELNDCQFHMLREYFK